MIITKTNAEWLECLQDLTAVANSTGVTAFAVNHNFRTVNAAVADYMDLRNGIITRYGVPNENGTYTIEDPELIITAQEQLKPLGDLEMDLDIVMLPENHLINSNILLAQMQRIEWMIKPISTELAQSIVGSVEEEETPDAEPVNEGEHYDPKDPITDERFV